MRKNKSRPVDLEPCACGGPKSAQAKLCQNCYDKQQAQLRGGIPLHYHNDPVNPTYVQLSNELIKLRDRLANEVKEQMKEIYDVDSERSRQRSFAHDQRIWKSRDARKKPIPEKA